MAISILPPARPVLGNVTARINNGSQSATASRTSVTFASSNPLPLHGSRRLSNADPKNFDKLNPAPNPAVNKRVSNVVGQKEKESNRLSQLSSTSTNAGSLKKRKTHVGPWHLGKTLGKGATGRVRFARHKVTGQQAAIKIVSKATALKMQSKSILAMDEVLAKTPQKTGEKTIPSSIEREVIIMKLVEHPNVIRLYDVWENRGEIYLIMEYIEGGELYGHINKHRRLTEYESVRIFRQVLSGLAYCHRLNIYHRDLKPENILLDQNENVKLVDFGMAALQPQGKWLKTSCGSPHYAAPEIAYGHKYRGAPADVWSSGVVLYAMLCGQLPFGSGQEGEDPRDVLKEVVKGEVHVPEDISEEAEDLILKMLQLAPDDRLTIDEIWEHPLLVKYEPYTRHQKYAAKWLGGPPPELTEEDCGKQLNKRSEIDRELLRSLCTLWQYPDEDVLVAILLSTEACYEKVFYDRLLKYRDEQLENYQGSIIEFSTSDYHHITRPSRRCSTRASSQPPAFARRSSKFSIMTDTRRRPSQNSGRQPSEAETEQSYDPYRSSRQQMAMQADHAKITLLRGQSTATHGTHRSSSAGASLRVPALDRVQAEAVYSISSSPPALPIIVNGRPLTLRRERVVRNYSRSSLTSSNRSCRPGGSGGIRASMSYKRGITFDQSRKRSNNGKGHPPRPSKTVEPLSLQQRYLQDRQTQSSSSLKSPISNNSPLPILSPEVHSRKERYTISYAEGMVARNTQSKRASLYWKEEARKVSSELENLCDEAFNPPFVPVEPHDAPQVRTDCCDILEPSAIISIANEARFASSSIVDPYSSPPGVQKYKYNHRPLPRPPLKAHIERKNNNELAAARELLQRRAAEMTPGALDDVLASIDRLMQRTNLGLSSQEYERRVASAPTRPTDPGTLSPVKEKDEGSPSRCMKGALEQGRAGSRVTSAPTTKTSTRYGASGWEKVDGVDRSTVRLVHGSSILRPEPLVIRKKSNISTTPDDPLRKKEPRDQCLILPNSSATQPSLHYNAPQPPDSRIGYNLDRPSGASIPANYALNPIMEEENKENVDPLTAKRYSAGSETKKRPWFRRNRSDQRSFDSDTPPTPPWKNSPDVPNLTGKEDKRGQRISDVPSDDSGYSEPKLEPFGRSKFLRIFGKKDPKLPKGELALTGRDLDDDDDDNSVEIVSTASGTWMSGGLMNYSNASFNTRRRRDRAHSGQLPFHRSIVPQPQNWLARLLHIKPATKIVAFQISTVRARKEITGIFRLWRQHGMRDVVVDKVAGRIWARVSEENLLHLKPVALACELFPVYVRGRRANLCVGRFTQEKGAKSSFERVVGTLEGVLRKRGCLVGEKRRAREMRACLQGR